MSEELPKQLLEIIKKGEKVTAEFKAAKTELPKNLFETVCSFLNRNGGHIFLGVANNGDIVGVDRKFVNSIKTDFANLCNNEQKISPTVYLQINEYEYEDNIILHIYVNESSEVHNTNGRVFDRNEDGDYEITRSTILKSDMYFRKRNESIENEIYPYVGMKDLRVDLIKRARQRAINRNDKHEWENLSDMGLLKSARLYDKDSKTGKRGFNLACILLFGKDETILSALPHHRTDAIYRVKNVDRYDDRDDIRTNLLDSYDRLMNFAEKHLDDRFHLEKDIRIDVRNKISREICANLLMHREYSNKHTARLIIEKDIIKTENANIPKKIGEIDLSNYTPYSKNPKIARVFKEIGFADELGSGVRNLVKYTKIYSGGVPILKDDDMFTTIIPINQIENTEQEPNKKTEQEKSNKIIDKNKAIIEYCKEPRSTKEIMNYIGLKHRPTFLYEYLNPLIKQGKIEMTMPKQPKNRNQKYITKKNIINLD